MKYSLQTSNKEQPLTKAATLVSGKHIGTTDGPIINDWRGKVKGIMKNVNCNSVLCIGMPDEIKAVWKSMYRAWKDDRSNLWPSHTDTPKFREGSVYGISIESGERHDTFYVCSADTTLRLLLEI